VSARIRSRRALLLGVGALVLTGCGVKGPPRRPPQGDPDYPRTYPPPDTVRPEALGADSSETDGAEEGDQ
jgi:hypothetical protein